MAEEFKIYTKQITQSLDGSEWTEKEEIDLLETFKGAQYKSISGLLNYGKPKVYTESFAETSEMSVYLTDKRSETEITLTLYFFPPSGTTDREAGYAEADAVYHNVVKYFTRAKIAYRDTFRKQKVLMYLSDAVTVNTDRLYGQVYKEVQFKFKNIYGRPFPLDDKTF